MLFSNGATWLPGGRLLFLGALSLILGLACAGLPVPPPTPAPLERGVHTPDDLRRYLTGFPERYVFNIDEDVTVLFADPNSLAEWVGAAFIYHIPSVSSVTLDREGTITERRYNTAESQERLEAVLAHEVLMDRIRGRIEEIWGQGHQRCCWHGRNVAGAGFGGSVLATAEPRPDLACRRGRRQNPPRRPGEGHRSGRASCDGGRQSTRMPPVRVTRFSVRSQAATNCSNDTAVSGNCSRTCLSTLTSGTSKSWASATNSQS